MGRFTPGEVIIVPFPYTNFSAFKRRPALVLSDLSGQDLIICAITSQAYTSPYAIPIGQHDFIQGTLRVASHIRPEKLVTTHENLVTRSEARLDDGIMRRVRETLRILLINLPQA